jgi:hypothetical protein
VYEFWLLGVLVVAFSWKGLTKKRPGTGWWLTPVIPATQEAEMRRIAVRSQLGQIVSKTLSQKTLQKGAVGGSR